ncbi:dipicolinate synthase subunit B [Candidatus Contubernalis alkalaceticus]|nr:dipicolinate synthase subunit B [Candidatus Contubernalis alkalaceticus]UNC91852.1 dipicolinate synthase subunit B [Candidatus Contubernalis alkalaceticus]
MSLNGLNIGIGITGSYCTFDKIVPVLEEMTRLGAEIHPIITPAVNYIDTRFGKAEYWKERIKEVTGREPIYTIVGAEPVGPKSYLDVMVVAPCTGNTLAKLANGITDTAVLMAVKAQLRNVKPVVIAISTNDGLGLNAKNLGILINMKNIFLVPFGQDNPIKKENSLVARMDLLIKTIEKAREGRQIQPILIEYQSVQ